LKTFDIKQQILEDAGFWYNFDREIYVSRKKKKAFSIEFLEEIDEKRLEERIRERTDPRRWRFYFKSDPSERVKRDLEAELCRPRSCRSCG
jgi:hypothetical protein